ncbi:porin [Rhodobacteraceae bacterium]|nr:porin [Paracoccaceae bacterium]
MMNKLLLATALAGGMPLAAMAADVNGASVGVSHYNYLGGEDGNRTSIGGQLELGFTPQFAMQGDMMLNHFGDGADLDGYSTGLHAIWNATPYSKFGLFAGFEDLDEGDVDLLGLEYGAQLNGVDFEAAYTRANGDSNINDSDIYNLSLKTPLTPQLDVGGRFDFADIDNGNNVRRFGVTGDYKLAGGYVLNGELGFVDPNHDDAESYIGLGIKAEFGGGDASFSRRGLAELIPGF